MLDTVMSQIMSDLDVFYPATAADGADAGHVGHPTMVLLPFDHPVSFNYFLPDRST